MRVGYVGLGAMGSALARRLLESHEVIVWDANPEAMATLAMEGARAAKSPIELCEDTQVLILCLPRSSDVKQVLFGTDRLVDALAPGTIVIDQTSGTPTETKAIGLALREREVSMLDAPVSGNPKVFASGDGTVLVSGPDQAFQFALPLLQSLSSRVMRCGTQLGDAQATKLINNTINSGCRIATLEIALMARKIGFALDEIIAMLNMGTAANSTTSVMLPALKTQQSATNFALRLMLKDLNQTLKIGLNLDTFMPIASLTRGLFQSAVNILGTEARLDQIVDFIEQLSNTRMGETQAPIGTSCFSDTAGREDLSQMLFEAMSAFNQAITQEAFALGKAYGLSQTMLSTIIDASSGWSGATRQPLELQSSCPLPPPSFESHSKSLKQACTLAQEAGLPMLMAHATLAALSIHSKI